MLSLAGMDMALYRAALPYPHEVYSRLDVVASDGTTVLIGDLPFHDGQVQGTLTNRVTRTLTATIPRYLMPLTAAGALDFTSPLAPVGNRVRAYRGITMGDGQRYAFPVFHGRVESLNMGSAGAITLTAQDLAAEVIDAEFEGPMNSLTTNPPVAEFQRLVSGGLPNATFGTSDVFGNVPVPQLSWPNDRGKALDDIAASVGAYWYTLADGRFVMRRIPWTVTQAVDAVLTDGPGGTLTDYSVGVSRTGVKNSVVYCSERQDGTNPVTVISRDASSTSPTYYRGPFGKKPTTIVNQLNQSPAQVKAAADAQLRALRALSSTWTAKIVPDASLELGDLLQLTAEESTDQPYQSVTSLQVLSGYTMPLREGTEMTLNLRSYTPR